jgi:hypothetical protein
VKRAVLLLPALLAVAAGAGGNTAPALAQTVAPAADRAAVRADYQRRLADYQRARDAYEEIASRYWASIAEKRKLRNAKRRAGEAIGLDDYVLTQPPVYSGPARPVDPFAPEEVTPRRYVPVVADFLKAAAEHYRIAPQRPRSESEFKRAYARIAAAAGLSRDQIVRIYAFEAGGNGAYDVQAGLESRKPEARAITTALGYNQLLHTNSVELMAEKGHRFLAALRERAAQMSGAAKAALAAKIAAVEAMVKVSRSVPDAWSEHEKLAATPKGLGIHAMNLDIDIGPLLQTQKLLDSIEFARRKGVNRPLTAAELEMMNLTGDGNGLDMVTMPVAMRDKVPTANFFQRAGYERNPVARRNNTVAALLAITDRRMDQESARPGARELAAAYPQ